MNKLVIGILYAIVAQVLTFFQLQGSIKLNLLQRFPVAIYAISIPMTWLYITSVKYFIETFNGDVWPSRLLGFAVGIVVFTILTEILFKEPFTMKTFVTLLLSIIIICIQIFWK